MKKKLVLSIVCALALVAAIALAGCGSSSSSSSSSASSSSDSSAATSETTTIKVGAVPTPHADILTNVVAPKLADQGINLEVVEFNEYVTPNKALDAGDIDANYFQHLPYLENFNEENGTDIVSVATIHIEPFAIYAGKCSSLEELKEKIDSGEAVSIAVPNDTTNEARALLLLAANGIIKLPDDANASSTITAIDIIEKADNLTIEELDAAQIPRSLESVDVACINGNYALEAGLKLADALAVEDVTSDDIKVYGNIIAVNNGDQDNDVIKALVEAATSDDVRNYIEENYGDSVVAVF